MGAPKSVVKIKKNGIEYISDVDKCSYYMFELTRAALRDVGKFVCRRFRENYYAVFKRRRKKAGKATRYNVYSNAKTKYPRVDIGLKGEEGFYSYFQEFGSSKTKRLGLLKKTVQENIAEIVEIESKYLSALEDEAKALALVSESEYEGDDNE